MPRTASAPSRTANAVVRRIEALQLHAADIERRCVHDGQRIELHGATAVLDEARAWLRAATAAEPGLVTHVARMVSGARERLYAVARQVH
jgi:hypothetical protein